MTGGASRAVPGADAAERRAGALLVVGTTFAVVALAALDSGLRQGTWQARVTYAGTAAAVVVVTTLARRRSERLTTSAGTSASPTAEERGHRGLAPWLAVAAVAATWDVLGLLTPPDRHHLTLSALSLAYQAFHAVVFAFWVAIGAVLVAAPLRHRGRA